MFSDGTLTSRGAGAVRLKPVRAGRRAATFIHEKWPSVAFDFHFTSPQHHNHSPGRGKCVGGGRGSLELKIARHTPRETDVRTYIYGYTYTYTYIYIHIYIYVYKTPPAVSRF